ncbi:MAG: glycosyltransferase family 2 protein [Armatimonadota bacterium]
MISNPKRIEISIIIVNWNTRELLQNCLSSIYSKPCNTVFDVYVVDNASTDGSAAMVRSQFPQVNLIENDVNAGYSRANNQGISASQGKTVLLLNSDTVVDPQVFDETLKLLHSAPSIGGLGCKLIGRDGNVQPSYSFNFPHGPKVGGPNKTVDEELVKCAFVWGAYLLLKREVIDQAGMLDEDFFMFYEDIDWCWRIHNAGWDIVYDSNHSIMHLSGASCSKLDAVAHRKMILKSLAMLQSKHNPRFSFKSWRIGRLMLYGRCMAWYGLLNKIAPSEKLSRKINKHKASYKAIKELQCPTNSVC